MGIFKMETTGKSQAYLLKNGTTILQYVGNAPNKCSGAVLVFTPKVENFKCFPDQRYDQTTIDKISEAIGKAGGGRHNNSIIAMYGKYDTFFDVVRVYTEVLFPRAFSQTLFALLPNAKIAIRGTYKLVHEREAPAPPPGLIHNNIEHLRAHCDPITGVFLARRPPTSRADIWEPVDGQEHQFSVENIKLQDHAIYANFNGIEKMIDGYKSHGKAHAQLNYSVILEWKDLGRDAPKFERQLLDKLYTTKLLTDCVIVASNKKELGCHQCIVAANSDVLSAMLESGMKESQTHKIEMEDVGEDALNLMLDYMYGKDLDFEKKGEEAVIELIKAAHKYNISELEALASRFLVKKPNELFTINGALALYFFTVNVESLKHLTEKLRDIMRSNTRELSASPTYQEWMKKEPKEAAEFVLALMDQAPDSNPNVGVIGEGDIGMIMVRRQNEAGMQWQLDMERLLVRLAADNYNN